MYKTGVTRCRKKTFPSKRRIAVDPRVGERNSNNCLFYRQLKHIKVDDLLAAVKRRFPTEVHNDSDHGHKQDSSATKEVGHGALVDPLAAVEPRHDGHSADLVARSTKQHKAGHDAGDTDICYELFEMLTQFKVLLQLSHKCVIIFFF